MVANANIKKCEKDLKDVTMMDIYEVDTAVKAWQKDGMSVAESWKYAEQMRRKLEGKAKKMGRNRIKANFDINIVKNLKNIIFS